MCVFNLDLNTVNEQLLVTLMAREARLYTRSSLTVIIGPAPLQLGTVVL